MLRGVIAVALICAVSPAAWAQRVTNAPAADNGENFMLRLSAGADQFCLDAKDNRQNEGTPIFVWRCHGRENQRWTVTRDQDGTSVIVGTGGFCLDVRGQTSRANGTPVQLWRCHFLKNQRLAIAADGSIREAESGKCLQATRVADGAPVVLDTCQNQPTEHWQFAH